MFAARVAGELWAQLVKANRAECVSAVASGPLRDDCPGTAPTRALRSGAGSGMNQSFYQFVGGRVSFNNIDAFRRNSTIGVILLARILLP